MTTKPKGESVRQKLNALSAKLGVKYSNLETVFLIERLVARLIADQTLHQRLVFKGGFVGMRVYESARYTVDLDALLVKSDVDSTLKKIKENAESNLNDGVWFRFEGQVDLTTQGEYGGIRHVYRAGIGEVLKNLKRAQIVNFDLGIGDPVTPGPQKMETPSLLTNDQELSWSVYPIETIIAEKLHTIGYVTLINFHNGQLSSTDFNTNVPIETFAKSLSNAKDFTIKISGAPDDIEFATTVNFEMASEGKISVVNRTGGSVVGGGADIGVHCTFVPVKGASVRLK